MRYLLLLLLIFEFTFAKELTRKIMVSSFMSQEDANSALDEFNSSVNNKFKKLQEKLGFNVIARPSDNFYVIAIEAFKDYKEAKLVLNEITKEHPDAYINKYTAPTTLNKEEKIELLEQKELEKQNLVQNDNEENRPEPLNTKEEVTIVKTKAFEDFKETQEQVNAQTTNTSVSSNDFKGRHYSFVYHSNDTILFKIKRNLSVYPLIKDSSIIKVEYKDGTAQRTSDFINELLKVYLEQNINENSKQLKETVEFIEVQLEKSKIELTEAERKLELFRSENLLFNIDKKVEQINKQKDELQKELLAEKRKEQIFNSMKDSLLRGEMISSSSFEDSVLIDTIKQLNDERSKHQELSAKYTPSHKTMIALKDKIESLEDTIIKNVKNIDLSLVENRKSLESQIKELNEEILLLPKLAMELSKLERRFNLKESVYKDLLLKYNDTSSKYISSKRVNRIIDYAQVPPFPVKPKMMIILVIGFMVSLLVAFIAVLLKEYMDIYLKRPSDLTNLTKTPYYGFVPFVKSKNYNKLFILDDLNSIESEALRRIRSSLDLTAKKDDSRVILTTSTVSNEGKSTFIANLAVMFALSGKKTIILGLDLRIPQLHMKFNVNNDQGMSDLLANNVNLADVIQTAKIDKDNNIDIITSGSIPPNPAELIENGMIDGILEKLRKEYDYILIDTTPTALVPDTLTLLAKADTTLFVFKSEHSKKEYVQQTDELIKKFELKSTGFVLTSVKKKYFEKLKYDKNYSLYATKS